MNKKGISTIIATVLIVLLTVAAISILWSAIIPLVKQSLPSGVNCLEYQNVLTVDRNNKYTNYDRYGTCNGAGDELESVCLSLPTPGTFSAFTGTSAKAQINIRIERAANTPNIEEIKILLDNEGQTVGTNTIKSTDSDFPTEDGIKIIQFDLIDDVATGFFEGEIAEGLTTKISSSVMQDGEVGECPISEPSIDIEKKRI